MTKRKPCPPEFQALSDRSMDFRKAAVAFDEARAALREQLLSCVPVAQAIEPDFQVLAIGPALSEIDHAGTYGDALKAHCHLDKLRRVLGTEKPTAGAGQRGPGGGR